MPHLRGLDNPDHKPLTEGMIAQFREDCGPVTDAADVAAAVFEAATKPSAPPKVPAGDDAVAWMAEAEQARASAAAVEAKTTAAMTLQCRSGIAAEASRSFVDKNIAERAQDTGRKTAPKVL